MITPSTFRTDSPEETVALGRKLAERLKPPRLVLLRGELGAGKTTLVKGIVEGFHAAHGQEVTSPTFTLIHEYRSPEADIYHIDLYRVDTLRELETLGIDDLFSDRAVIVIEWGEKFERFRRERDEEIAIVRTNENQRSIELIA